MAISTLVALPDGRSVQSSDLYTKAEYARKITKSQTWVDRLLDDNKLHRVVINGSELVCEPSAIIEG